MTDFLGYLILGISQGLVYGLLALGMVLIYKGSRTLNLAHPYFGLLGAYLAWWLTARAAFLPFAQGSRPRFAVAAVIALALVSLNGFLLERDLFRKLRGAPRLVVLVATIAIAQGTLGIVSLLFNRNDDQLNQTRSLPAFITTSFDVGNLNVRGGYIQVLVVVPLLALGSALFFKYSRFGVAIRAAAENGESARLLGISTNRVSSFTWVVGSFFAALAGLMITVQRGSLDISTLSTGFLVRALAAALIGGLTSLPGALVGGLAVGVSEAMLGLTFGEKPGLPETLLFIVVVLVLAFRPGGLFGQREETEDKVAFVPTIKELPRVLAASSYARWLSRFSLGLVAVAVFAVSLISGSTVNGIFVDIIVFAIVGVSLTVLMGFTGQISLGHWALVGVGAFAAANLFTRFHVPFLLTVPLVVVIGMIVSLVIGLPALRIRGLYLAVVTLAFAYAAEFYIFKSQAVAGSQAGIQMDAPKLGPLDLDDPSNRPLLLFSVLLLVVALLVARNLSRTRTGRSFFALRENEKAAATLGVDLTRAKLLAFAVSGGIAALAGVIAALRLGNVNSTSFETATSLVLVAMVMIGGLGSLQGAVLGAFLVEGLPLLIELDNPWIVPIGTGILLLIVIVRARGGLAGLVQLVRRGVVTTLVDLDSSSRPPAAPATSTG